MRILNCYAGIGGNRKLWGKEHKVTAIEYEQEIADIYKDNFPNDTVIVTDAHSYLLTHIKEFDFIWCSPPCPTHSALRQMDTYSGQNEIQYPDMALYQEIILLKYFANKTTKWVVENVNPYYKPLIPPTVILNRHYFWSNFYIRTKGIEDLDLKVQFVENNTKERYGFDISKYKLKTQKRKILRNLVNPKIGLYILEQSEKGIKPLFNFDY